MSVESMLERFSPGFELKKLDDNDYLKDTHHPKGTKLMVSFQLNKISIVFSAIFILKIVE